MISKTIGVGGDYSNLHSAIAAVAAPMIDDVTLTLISDITDTSAVTYSATGNKYTLKITSNQHHYGNPNLGHQWNVNHAGIGFSWGCTAAAGEYPHLIVEDFRINRLVAGTTGGAVLQIGTVYYNRICATIRNMILDGGELNNSTPDGIRVNEVPYAGGFIKIYNNKLFGGFGIKVQNSTYTTLMGTVNIENNTIYSTRPILNSKYVGAIDYNTSGDIQCYIQNNVAPNWLITKDAYGPDGYANTSYSYSSIGIYDFYYQCSDGLFRYAQSNFGGCPLSGDYNIFLSQVDTEDTFLDITRSYLCARGEVPRESGSLDISYRPRPSNDTVNITSDVYRPDGVNQFAIGCHEHPSIYPTQFVIDSGAVYVNYGEVGQYCLGATRGGNTFEISTEYTDMGHDGALGSVKGAKFASMVKASLSVNMIEITPELLALVFPGSSSSDTATHTEITRNSNIASGNYLTNVTLVGEVFGKNQPIICTLYNALPIGNFEIAMVDKNESVVRVKFMAHNLLTDLETEPWKISWPI